MLKNTLLVTLIGCSLVTSSFAFNIPHLVGAGQKKHTPSLALKGSNSNKTHTNFSGTWTGSCVFTQDDSRNEESVTWTIVNDYDFIMIDNEKYTIGGFHTVTDSSKNESIDIISMFNWAAGGTQLLMDSAVIVRSNSPISMDVSSYKTSFVLNNGQLIASGSIVGEGKVTTECRLDLVK